MGAAARQDILMMMTFGDLVPSVYTEGSWNSVVLWRMGDTLSYAPWAPHSTGMPCVLGQHQAGQGRGRQLGGDSREAGCSPVKELGQVHTGSLAVTGRFPV